MNYRVTSSEKNGQPAKPVIFGNPVLAARYAKSVRNGKVEPIDGDAIAAPTITACPVADAAMVKAATKSYYERNWTPTAGRYSEGIEPDSAEQEAERRMEFVCQARLMGASTSDALDDARDAA